MSTQTDWNVLSHEQKIDLLKANNDNDLVNQYLPPQMEREEFRKQLAREKDFWRPDRIQEFFPEGRPPTKATTIGAWRDLTRAEALLELMDNSIDAWMRRSAKVAVKYRAKTLQIYIRVDPETNVLEYRDNAGGVPKDSLINLVIPGYSTTLYEEATIGSYRTGGKKALFRLGEEVSIRTNYWNPSGTNDEAYEIHLDKVWLQDESEYTFPCFLLKTSPDDRGQTVYRFKMRHEPGEPWYMNREILDSMTKEIRRTYTLLLLRHPDIEIYFLNDPDALTPLEDLYEFSGTNESGTDLRPQRVVFMTQLEWLGTERPVEIEIVLGCRTSTGGDGWGIDLYGNDRLFAAYVKEDFVNWYHLGTQQVAKLLRGFINIKGPNVFVPWDTHKRHFNPEREIVTQILQKDPRIKEFFRNWSQAYKDLSKLGLGGLSKAIRKKHSPWKDPRKNDLFLPISGQLSIRDKKKRQEKALSPDFHKPIVAIPTALKMKTFKVSFPVNEAEFRALCAKHDVEGAIDEQSARDELGDKIKTFALRAK